VKILFITHAFPPFNSIGAVRSSKTTKHLFESGYEIKVISCDNQLLPNNLALEIPNQLVEYTNWFNVNSPLQYILGKKKVAAKGFVPASKYLPNWIQSLGFLYRNLINFPDGQIGWYPFAKQAGERLIKKWKPDLIFASASPYTSLLIACYLSKKHKIPWVAELRDLWVDNHNNTALHWRLKLDKLLEKRVLCSASGLVTVSSPLKNILESKYSIPCEVVTNGFDPDDIPNSPNVPFSDGLVRIVYTGTVYNYHQDPSPIFKALQLMGKDKEKVRIHFYGRFLSFSQQRANEHQVGHLVEHHDSVSHQESISIQTQADVLLLLCGHAPSWKGVYTGKLFEYLGARRPIICIGISDGVAANLIHELSVGVNLNDPEKIAAQLKEWVIEKKEKGEISYLPSEKVKEYTRKAQTKKLINFFHLCLNTSGSN
jgi:hypothetical protein